MTKADVKITKNTPSKRMLISVIRALKLPVAVGCLLLLIIHFSDILAQGAYEGVKICIESLIPQLLPFMVLTETAILVIGDDVYFIGGLFEKIFGIRRRGVLAYLSGVLCGYPVGISAAVTLRKNGLISKEEGDLLIAMSANPSLAFAVVGVGVGICASLYVGILLYCVTTASGVLTALFFRRKGITTEFQGFIVKQKLDFSAIIISSARKMSGICAFVVFFRAASFLIDSLVYNRTLYSVIAALTEITSGIGSMQEAFGLTSPFRFLSLAAFSLSFGGISVLCQAVSLISSSDLSFGRFLKFKLTHATLSFVLCFIVLCFAKII